MAAYRLGSTVPNTPLLSSSRHHASQNQNTGEDSRLPTGRCNFTNLSVGGNAPRCGCRRFWDKTMGTQAGEQVKSGFCMCEHHACYHDDVPEGYTSNTIQGSAPRTSGDVVMSDGSTTVQNTPLRQPQHLARIQERDEAEGEEMNLRPESMMPDTAQWNRYVYSGPPSDMSLPAIPSQCLLPSENGSVISYGGSSYLRPFGGLGSRALSHIPTPSAQTSRLPNAQNEPERSMQIYEDGHGVQSPTEVATPSVRASQDPAEDLGQNIANVQEALDKYAEGRPHTEIALRPGSKGESVRIKQSGSGPRVESLILHDPDDENLLPRIKHVMGQLMDYPNKIQNHEHRLEQLENTSFSNGQIDDLRDDHERVDTRVGELEDRVGDLDRQMASISDGSICGRQHVSSIDCGGSVTSSAMIASAIDRVDPSRIEALEAHIAELQAAALPSHSRPWELEVVFLPFGSRLMGIWSSQYAMSQRPRLGSTMTDEWTQTQKSLAAVQKALASYDHTSGWEKSATDFAKDVDNPWLMAKACGLGSRVDERLRSRGLVKLVQVYGAEARDVQAAVMKAFGDLPDILAEDPYTLRDENAGSVPQPLKPYFGLSNPWIPLRKLHKDSCLRYLNPSEMVTPALWTSSFLSTSVAMRHTKVRRLFITHRDSYIQHLGRDLTDWTWQKLRQLPRIYPDQPSFSHTPEADAHEPCWEYDERLDPPHESFHSSISSHISQLSIQNPSPEPEDFDLEPASPSDHFSSAAVSRNASTTPTSVAPTGHPLSPLKERKERDPFRARPTIHERTASMPSLVQVPIKSPHLTNKRRITSFDHERDDVAQIHSSPSRATSISTYPHSLQLKRRRTQSPSKDAAINPINNANQLSRFSAGPPSPYTYMDEITSVRDRDRERERGREKGKERERGMTPFAYATPHSNAPYIERDRERSDGPISVYEDESVAGNENFGFAGDKMEKNADQEMDGEDEESGSVTDEVELEVGFYTENQGGFDVGRGIGSAFSKQEGEEYEGSVDLDQPSAGWYSPSLSQPQPSSHSRSHSHSEEQEQERQIDSEWEGVAESPGFGFPIGDVVDPDEDEDEDGGTSQSSGVPSEYPSTLNKSRFRDEGAGFMIHVDDENEEDSGDDELV